MTPFEAWHFLAADRRLRNDDGRAVVVGETLTVAPPLVLCEHGLHWSRRAIDALGYAPETSGLVVCRVRVSGEILEPDGEDKGCSSERTVLWLADADRPLHEFACRAAERALDRAEAHGEAIDPRSRAAIAVKRRWLSGEATDRELDAAWDAAWDAAGIAAGIAAWIAARTAAGIAAWTAARDAAWAAAGTAARDAAGIAAWTAARTAARTELNAELERRLLALGPTEVAS